MAETFMHKHRFNLLPSGETIEVLKQKVLEENNKKEKLELSGAWWKSKNIDYMLSVQLNHANSQWGSY